MTVGNQDYLIVGNKNKLHCIICMQILSILKEYNVKRHLHYVSRE